MFNEICIESIKHKSLKVKIYPSETQEILINKTFGYYRQIFNFHLQEKNEYEQSFGSQKNIDKITTEKLSDIINMLKRYFKVK